jgi:L,D-transpeptidase YcbB
MTSANADVLPSINSQNEIKWQLLELASANFDKRFAIQFDRVISNINNEKIYVQELGKAYYLIKKFRTFYATLQWQNKQDFDFIFPIVSISKKDFENYNNLVLSGRLFEELVNLRPNTPYYLDYRHEIEFYLKREDIQIAPYKFKVVNEKSSGDNINILKKSLKAKGYLDSGCPIDGIYDLELSQAIKNFQSDYGLVSDGIVGEKTYQLLFMSNNLKVVELARSILRLSDVRLQNFETYILVNIPDAFLHVYSNGTNVIDSRVIVGKLGAKTPMLDGVINNVVFNPTWTVPSSIKKDYLSKLKKDPYYLQKKGIWIVDKDNNVVDPGTIDISNFEIGKFHYSMKQDSGVNNALGLYKFNFPNSLSIYLHSTSQPHLFKKVNRALSSGCIRVEKSRELAEFLLKGTYFTPKNIGKIVSSGETKWANLPVKTPLFIAYWTAYIGQNKVVYFRNDIYNIDTPKQKLPLELSRHF